MFACTTQEEEDRAQELSDELDGAAAAGAGRAPRPLRSAYALQGDRYEEEHVRTEQSGCLKLYGIQVAVRGGCVVLFSYANCHAVWLRWDRVPSVGCVCAALKCPGLRSCAESDFHGV